MSSICTKEVILSLIDDIELISRELLDNCVAPKPKRMSASEHTAITDLLIEKDKQLRDALSLAGEQGNMELQIDAVRAQVDEQDSLITNLQRQLKEAEGLLSEEIYKAKQKLDSVSKAQPVLSGDLIKYSHKISASNGVAAPPNWQQGDPRRPYPTDIEMRGGFLARAELPLSQQLQHLAPPTAAASSGGMTTFPSPAPPPQPSPGRGGSISSSSAHSHSPGRPSQQQHGGPGHFGWNSAGELSMQVPGGGQVHIETGRDRHTAASGAGGGEEVEVMSTDSSSSSSTDSN